MPAGPITHGAQHCHTNIDSRNAGVRVLRDTIDRLLLKGVGYRLQKQKTNSLSGPLGFEDVLRFYLSWMHVPDRDAFVQIGANDGVAKDPLHAVVVEYELHGVLVEPQQGPFERLRENYGSRRGLTFLNVAIAESVGEMQLWQIKDSFRAAYDTRAKNAASGVASFDKRHVVRHIMKNAKDLVNTEADAERHVECVTVRVMPLNDLISEHVSGDLQILQIDAEGYDYEILGSLDFGKYRPRIINYESKHLSPNDMRACEALLHANGYVTFGHGVDTCALLIRQHNPVRQP
jgi:FkbM family methyltransferase